MQADSLAAKASADSSGTVNHSSDTTPVMTDSNDNPQQQHAQQLQQLQQPLQQPLHSNRSSPHIRMAPAAQASSSNTTTTTAATSSSAILSGGYIGLLSPKSSNKTNNSSITSPITSPTKW